MRLSLLARNIAALGFFQVASQLIALATIPFLARTLGVFGFGELVLTQAAMRYCLLFIEFGFPWSATRQIAASKGAGDEVSAIFSRTWAWQWILTTICASLLLLMFISIPAFNPYLRLGIAGFSIAVGSVIAPTWLLLGLEQMVAIGVAQTLGNLLALGLLLLCIEGAADVVLALTIYGGTLIATNVVLTIWIFRKGMVRWVSPTPSDLLRTAKEGFPVFTSTIFISFYTVLPSLAVGMLSSITAGAYFNVADKARAAATSAMQPAFTALLPRMSRLFAHDVTRARELLRISVGVTAGVSGGASLILFLGANAIVDLVAGPDYIDAGFILKWMSPLPFIVSLSSIASLQILVPNKKIRQFNAVLVAAGAFGLTTIVPFVLWRGAIGAAQCLLLTEVLVCMAMWWFAATTVLQTRH